MIDFALDIKLSLHSDTNILQTTTTTNIFLNKNNGEISLFYHLGLAEGLAQNIQYVQVRVGVCVFEFNVAFIQFFSHITTVSGCDRELNAHFCSAASLKYHVPDT